jgi:hypothetical protein
MARTGLRMMPTFPSSPLRFRTVGFPQYGSKANISSGPSRTSVGLSLFPAYASARAVCATLRNGPSREKIRLSVQIDTGFPLPLCKRHSPLYPRGPWLRDELCCLSPSSLTTAPCVSPSGTSRFHGSSAYTQRLRCAGTPRRPAGPSLLLLPCFPCMPSTLLRRSEVPSRCYLHLGSRLPPVIRESPPTTPVSTSNSRRENRFRSCIVHFMLRPACLPSPPGWLQRDEVICSSPRLLRTLSLPLFTASVTGYRWESG